MAKPSTPANPANPLKPAKSGKLLKQNQQAELIQASAKSSPHQDKQLLQALRDDVSPEASPALQFLLDNAKAISTVVVLGIIIAVAVIIYHWNYKKNIEQAKSDIAAVLVSQQGNKRIEALENLLPEVPDQLLDGLYLEMVYTAEEIKEPAKATELWDKIYNHTQDSALKIVAGIGKAKGLAAQDKNAEALALLETLSQTENSALLPQVRMQLAMLAEKTGDLQKSRDTYQLLLINSGEFDKAFLTNQIELLNQKINQE